MARRTKLNAEVQRRILQAIQAGATYEMAAQLAGITRVTMYYWLQKGEEQTRGIYRTFFNEFKKAEAVCCVGNLAIINKEAKAGTWQAAAWLLERRFPEYRKDSPPVQINIDIDGAPNPREDLKIVNEQLKMLTTGPVIDLDED
jgi:hypothetical protein